MDDLDVYAPLYDLPDDQRLLEMLEEIDRAYLEVATAPITATGNFAHLISLAEHAATAIDDFLAYARLRSPRVASLTTSLAGGQRRQLRPSGNS